MLYFLTGIATVNCREYKRIAVKKSNRIRRSISAREKNVCINSMEINETLNFRYDFGKSEKETCVNSAE